jgi:uncharacterized membrane protein YuzA (DUF378 family)
MLLPGVLGHRDHPGFSPVYRVFGLVFLFLPVILLANEGDLSYLPLSGAAVRIVYQVLGFAGGAAAIGLGITRREKEMVYGGSIAFVALLYSKFIFWWWDWIPKYLFFLIVGVSAIVVLLILKRLRAALAASLGEAPA